MALAGPRAENGVARPGLRQLGPDHADAAARVYREAFDERLPWLRGLHTPEEDLWFFRERVFPFCAVWGAFEGAAPVGIIAFRPGWIDQLYVRPAFQGRGWGSALLEQARTRAGTLSLWTFRRNAAARAFYERHGFAAMKETDGSGNEEREPDVLYRWSAPGPSGA